jgi:uncharacterized protein YecE (DUF72 family)
MTHPRVEGVERRAATPFGTGTRRPKFHPARLSNQCEPLFVAEFRDVMQLYVGTSGYSYAEWKGSFYPEDLPAKKMLAYYAERLSSVEINNTFYRLPTGSVLEGWTEQVPESFRFSIKASRRITHFARLKPDAFEPTEYMMSAVNSLGSRLGVVLFQLPPNMKRDLERLLAFLEVLPAGTRAAFEFRHESWRDDRVHDALRAHGMALVCADTEESAEDEPIVPTAPWGYLRLRRPDYADADVQRWVKRVADTGWERAFVFFKHEDEGAGPRLAGRFLELAGGGAPSEGATPAAESASKRVDKARRGP